MTKPEADDFNRHLKGDATIVDFGKKVIKKAELTNTKTNVAIKTMG